MVDWQWIVIAVVALASLGRMAAAVVGLFSRRAEATAVVREATAAESALVGSIFPEGARAFDAWSYRVGASRATPQEQRILFWRSPSPAPAHADTKAKRSAAGRDTLGQGVRSLPSPGRASPVCSGRGVITS